MNDPPLRNGLHYDYDHGRADARLVLDELSRNPTANTILEQFITELEITTTMTGISVCFVHYNATPENNRRFIEPLCRCIANLRQHNPNHPLCKLYIHFATKEHRNVLDQLLLAAKQYGIYTVLFFGSHLRIQSLVKFCRDNTHIQILGFTDGTSIAVADDAAPVSQPQDSSAILDLDVLFMYDAFFENEAAATHFLNWMAHVTYRILELGKIAVENHIDDAADEADADYEEKKSARLRIVSKLLKPSVEQLTLVRGCHIETMDAIAACTVAQIQLDDDDVKPVHFRSEDTEERLQTIATRNRELARFVANPRAYPHKKLLKLMRQFDRSPTGRYMLACSIVGMPSFIKIKSTDSATTGPKTSTNFGRWDVSGLVNTFDARS